MAIDKEKIVEETLKLKVVSNALGLIPFFGVHIQRLPVDFWNGFARRIINSVPEELLPSMEELLVNAARQCGYHTAHGVILSREWTMIVSTMVRTIEDMLHAVFVTFSVWGWGNTEIKEIVPKQKMIVRAYDYYESDVVLYGRAGQPSAYMMRGMCAAFMDLAYGKPYPAGMGTFYCVQTRGIEIGDDYGEFVVSRNPTLPMKLSGTGVQSVGSL
ncbi:MAG: hypothetical protein ABIL58_24875 [Pseudomonadota bacterium]